MVSSNAKIGLAGLILMDYIEKSQIYKQGASQIISFFKQIETNYEDFNTDPDKTIKEYISKVTESVASQIIRKIVDGLELKEANDQTLHIVKTIHNIFEIIHKTIIPSKTSLSQEKKTALSMPGDIIHFLKVLFMSICLPDTHKEMRIYISSLNISTSQTIVNTKTALTRQRMTPIFIDKLIPSVGSSGTTIDFETKKQIINNIISHIPVEY